MQNVTVFTSQFELVDLNEATVCVYHETSFSKNYDEHLMCFSGKEFFSFILFRSHFTH